LDTAAAALSGHADRLDGATAAVRGARATTAQSWDSAAGDISGRHLATLESAYAIQADRARALSEEVRRQAQNFARARAQIPAPMVFDDLERRLQAANAANSAAGSRGMYTGVITELQTELAAVHRQAVDNYGRYAADSALHTAAPAPGVAPTTESAGEQSGLSAAGDLDQPVGEFGSGAVVLHPDGAAALDQDGGAGQPHEAAGELLQAVLPAVLAGVAGAAGGLLGAFSGIEEKLQQSGSQLLSGLTQGAGQAISAAQGLAAGQELSGSDGGGVGDRIDSSGLGGGGGAGLPGDTEPASSPGGPLAAAPASAAAAPAAAPATFSPSVSASGASTAPTGGMPMGGMMPPMMGAPRGAGGSGEEDRRLYPEKRLRLETAPNTEPVRNRREVRESRLARGE
jgi:hypothetical protein